MIIFDRGSMKSELFDEEVHTKNAVMNNLQGRRFLGLIGVFNKS